MTAFSIRQAEPGDLATVHALIRGLAEYERLAHEMVASEADLAEALFGERPIIEALVAESAGEAVGLALFYKTYSTFQGQAGLYLEDLFVLPKARGQGIGLGLLVELARIALSRGCFKIDWSVLDWNETALDFYRALGATARDQWTAYRLAGDALSRLAQRVTKADTKSQ
jgi:GNAT superfamily N-acetyltransferase